MNIEEIKDRVNLTKNAFHKLGIEGQVNINVMLNDIEFLLKEIEELKYKYSDEKIRNTIIKRYREVIEKDYVSKDKIKAKIDYLLKHYDSENFINFEMFIKILQSLLEEE